MSLVKYLFTNVVETLLRGLPFPCKTGLIRIGHPGKNAPVFLTCNYHLTVERVKRTLKEIDCYLLVANSRGINVWCAAAGGHFTSHDVISALKTSGIEEIVNHRKVILPQLAATGIESRVIQKKTGWNVVWGPVYAKDIPAFLKCGSMKTPEMREVKFPLVQRIEIAAMWAFPFSIIASIITLPFWREIFLPLISLIWSLPFLIFGAFPLYSKWLNPKKKREGFSKYTVIFDFSRIPLVLEVFFLVSLLMYSMFFGVFSWGFILRWGLISFIIVLLLSIDLMGSTPLYKSGLHEDRFLRVVLDEEKCKGAGFCEQVCPRNCYEVDKGRGIAAMPRDYRCVQCGACIVQCPFDALYFKNPKGEVITPELIRRFKLNLIGKRLVKVER
jgi:NAD-dependent dihydropyrimidine dehydrogenase PreA subunit